MVNSPILTSFLGIFPEVTWNYVSSCVSITLFLSLHSQSVSELHLKRALCFQWNLFLNRSGFISIKERSVLPLGTFLVLNQGILRSFQTYKIHFITYAVILMEKQPTQLPSWLRDMWVSSCCGDHVRSTDQFSRQEHLGHSFRNRATGITCLVYSYNVVVGYIWGWLCHLLLSFLFVIFSFLLFFPSVDLLVLPLVLSCRGHPRNSSTPSRVALSEAGQYLPHAPARRRPSGGLDELRLSPSRISLGVSLLVKNSCFCLSEIFIFPWFLKYCIFIFSRFGILDCQ